MSENRRTDDEALDTAGSTTLATRRAVLAAGGAVALGGLAGCSALDEMLDSASEQVVGTTVSAPAALYAGRPPSDASASSDSGKTNSAGTQFFSNGPAEVQHVPATIRADSQTIELEGWSSSAVTKAPDYNGDNTPIIKGSALGRAQDYNSSRSNKFEWWAGPDDEDDDDDDGDVLEAIHDVELGLLGHVTTAQAAVEREDQAATSGALDGFINTTEDALRPTLDKCGTGVCETVRENSDSRVQGIRIARRAVDEADWAAAMRELEGVEEIVLGDIERLDDELVERDPGRPRFIDIIEYLRDAPTIGESFTVCLPDASLPGGPPDRLPEEIKPEIGMGLFAGSDEDGGRRPPFHERYGTRGIEYDEDGCLQLDGPLSLQEDMACQNIISANLDTYRTANRGIVGFSTEGGAVVSGAPASADTDGKCVFVAPDGTLRESESLESWGRERTAGDVTVSQTLVCPVAVTPEDCPCPLPGLFYIRRVLHDEQIILAGGWMLDEGALYENSMILLFDEGPTEIVSVTPEDIESDDYDDRVVEQFARDRSQYGSLVASAQVEGTEMNKAELIEQMASEAFQTDEGRKGLNAVNVKVVGEQGGSGDSDDGSGDPIQVTTTALDAPLVHLAGAGELSKAEKVATGRVETGVINSGEEVDILGMGAEKLSIVVE